MQHFRSTLNLIKAVTVGTPAVTLSMPRLLNTKKQESASLRRYCTRQHLIPSKHLLGTVVENTVQSKNSVYNVDGDRNSIRGV